STVPPGGATFAVLETLVPPAPVTFATTVKVTLDAAGSVGIASPDSSCATVGAVGHTAPPVSLPQATEVFDRPAAAGSASNAPSAASGPALVTTMVYVVALPDVTPVTPLVLVRPRSDCGTTTAVIVVGSLALSLARFVSPPPETVAVLVRLAGAAASTSTVSAIVG